LGAIELADGRGIAIGFLAEFAGEIEVEDVVCEGGLAGAGDACQADKEAKRDVGIEFLQVVAGGSFDGENLFGGLAAGGGDGDGALAGEPRCSAV